MPGHKIHVWEDGSEMGPGAPVYFPEGTSLCDDGPDKRGTGTSKALFNQIFSWCQNIKCLLYVHVH